MSDKYKFPRLSGVARSGSRIALVTHRGLPMMPQSDQLLAQSLRRFGIEVREAPWDDRGVDWSVFDLVVLRSCWNYHRKPGLFLRWLDSLESSGVNVMNPAPVVRWNLDKHYLGDLRARGVNVVPTYFVRHRRARLADLLARLGWSDAVVKPAVGASGYGAYRVMHGSLADGQRHLSSILLRSAALVQPFVPGILSGEYSLVFIDGSYSHAILRSPPPKDFRVSPNGDVKAVSAPPELIDSARSAVAQVPGIDQCLYARVDGIPSKGGILIMEVELIEPCLWFELHTAGARALAAALAERIRAARNS